jgi:hypothetical protein
MGDFLPGGAVRVGHFRDPGGNPIGVARPA